MQEGLKSGRRENAVFLLKLGETGKSRHAMIREVTTHSISHQIIHLDFQRILMTDKVRVQVPLELTGEAIGVKNEEGVLDFVNREVLVECLPANIPSVIQFDVSELHVGQHAEFKDLSLPDEIEVVDEPEKVIVSVALSRVAAEVEEEEEEEGLLLEQEADEPEVIGRVKETEDEEESQ
jgi:large subunit ribosomal protein L25